MSVSKRSKSRFYPAPRRCCCVLCRVFTPRRLGTDGGAAGTGAAGEQRARC
ncbi:hypothetical protein M8494_01610 [Serratia ureilytica]